MMKFDLIGDTYTMHIKENMDKTVSLKYSNNEKSRNTDIVIIEKPSLIYSNIDSLIMELFNNV